MPGAKKAQAQRTKGNVKPSSSSQAAQLLAASGHAPTGFIGFSNQPAFVPASETFDDAESILDGDFRLVLRKLSKRDTVTKIKALQEFSSLCNSKDEESVKAVVPFWPRIYNKVAIDVDHKVRELSQRALAMLAARAGKTIAPHLKSIMGTWMVSMCDTYPTVASAANTAFTNTFPVAKQTEAVRFCKIEITECLMTNIIKQTPQTLSDTQTTSEEDMESKYQRVVSSSLQAFRKLLFMMPSDSVSDAMSGHLSNLLASPVFWKHAKSDVPTIKNGVLSLLSAACQLCPDASSKVLNKTTPFIFSCLDSTDASLVSYTWEATLSLISSHQDCWQHVNWQKAVWPKIKRVLESGCSGQAVFISPCLLPLLSKMPNKNFTQFFDAFRLGFSEESVLNSPMDISALVRGFVECIQYSVKCIAESGSSNSEMKNLILDQVLVVVQASLTDPKPGLSKTELYASICPLLATVGNIDPTIEHDFWTDLSSFIRGRLLVELMPAGKTSSERQGKHIHEPPIFQRVTLLVQGLVYQQAATAAKKERVKFGTEEMQQQPRRTYYDKEKQKLSESAETLISDMFVTIFKLASVEEKAAPLFFSLFKDLSVLHIPQQAAERLNNRTDQVAVTMAVDLGIEPGTALVASSEDDLVKSFKSQLVISEGAKGYRYREFLCDQIVKLLLYAEREERAKGLGEGQFTDDVVQTLFAFVSYVDEGEGANILSVVLHSLTEPQITCQFIEHLLGHVKFVPACRQLVEGTELAGKIETLTMSVSGREKADEGKPDISSSVWKMLTSVVSSLDESDNHLFSESCLDAVMSSCVATLKQLQSCDLNQKTDTLSSVISLVQALCDKHKVSTHPLLGELVQSLLPLLLNTQLTEEETTAELESVWLTGFRVILDKKSHVEIEQHTLQSCAIIREWVQSRVLSHDGLSLVGKIVRLLVKTVASPSSVADDENDDKENDESGLESGSAVEEDYDLNAVSSAIDSLLIADPVQLDCVKELYEYLYINGSLLRLPSAALHSHSASVPLQSLIVGTLHNFGVLVLNIDLSTSGAQGSDSKQICCQWSETQLRCLAELAYRLILLETAKSLKPEGFREFPETLLADLRTGLTRCYRTLTQEQLSAVVDLVAERSDDSSPAFTFGLTSVLEGGCKAQMEESEKISPFIKSSLLSTRINFLPRCLQSNEVAAELCGLLTEPGVSGHSICEAFTLASAVLLSCEDVNVADVADCISGFMALAKDYDVLKDEVKLSVFQQVTDIVKQLKEKDVHLLSGSDSSSPSAEHTHLNVSLARALKLLIVPCNEQYWEFTLCALVEWIQFVSEAKVSQKSDAVMKALLAAVCELAHLAAQTFATAPVAAEGTPESTPDSVTEKTKTEWSEFFSEGVFSPLLPLFVSIASSTPPPSDRLWSLVLRPLAAAVSACPGWLVLAHQLPARLTATDTSGVPDSIKTLLNHLCPLLLSRHRCVEVAAYRMLTSVVEEIPKHETTSEEDDKQEEEQRSPPEALIQHAEAAGHFLECLKVVQVEDNIVMDRGTKEHAQAMGYLLSWRLLLQLFRCSPNQLRAKYAQYFKANNSVSDLLDRLFRLIPPHPSSSMLEFTAELDVTVEESEAELGILAMFVYRQCLEILPAIVRTWWVDQDRKTSNFIDRFTTQYLSSSLIWQQITSAQNTDSDMEGITIRARPAAREVSATYEMAEVTINMSITLPENYPLGKLDVACDKRVGVSQAQWDRWLLQLNIFLQHQNGSIVEGLRLWKGNIDKKFEGIEDCMICFSVIHGTTFQLPRLTCKTCRKKFHSACLYKWFSTSQKSSCPLCRNLF